MNERVLLPHRDAWERVGRHRKPINALNVKRSIMKTEVSLAPGMLGNELGRIGNTLKITRNSVKRHQKLHKTA